MARDVVIVPDRECPEGLNAEPIDGWVAVYGAWASLSMSPESALKSADRLRLAAEAAIEQRERQRA